MTTKPRAKRATSYDVARLASVSQTTVSLIVNEAPTANISQETRARVHAAIAQLDYHPHEAARSLRRRSTHDIGVVIPDATNPHYVDIIAGIEAHAGANGYSTFVSATGFDTSSERRSLHWLKQQRIDALILCSLIGTDWYEDARQMLEQGYTITTLGIPFPVSDTGPVSTDTELGERLTLEHLAALGHRRIGYIYGVFDQQIYGARLQRCLAVQRELGLPVIEDWVRRCGPTRHEGYHATESLLAACAGAERPTALVVVNDHLALGVLAALHRAGVAVPAAMSVSSFDNTNLAPYTIPSLTSVDVEARAMGERAARLTIERLSDPQQRLALVQVEPRLVVRDSTGPAPSASGRDMSDL